MGFAGIILFILTEDMRNPMVLIDRWTIFNLCIFLIEIFAIMAAMRYDKRDEEEYASA